MFCGIFALNVTHLKPHWLQHGCIFHNKWYLYKKKKFDDLCKDFGISANTAFNMFARAVIKQERIPFDVNSEKQARIQRAWEAAEQIL